MLRTISALLLCSACMAPMGSAPDRQPAAPPEIALAELAAAVLDESNRARAAADVPALKRDAAAERAAMRYASELAALRTLSHRSPVRGRETLTQRIEAEGGTWMLAGENLARMRGPNVNIAQHTIRLWLDSPGHRSNLLSPEFTHSGAGVATDLYGAWYVVQIYTLPRALR